MAGFDRRSWNGLYPFLDDIPGLRSKAEPLHGRANHRDPARAEGRWETTDVCRKYGVSSGTFYKWNAKYGGLDVSDAKRLKALEDENPKKLSEEAELDKAILREIAAKNSAARREAVEQHLRSAFLVSGASGRYRSTRPLEATASAIGASMFF